MGAGGLESLAFVNRAVGLTNLAARWENPILDFKVDDRRSSREEGKIFFLLPLSWKSSCWS